MGSVRFDEERQRRDIAAEVLIGGVDVQLRVLITQPVDHRGEFAQKPGGVEIWDLTAQRARTPGSGRYPYIAFFWL